jgi:hypothetical protein
MDRRQLFDRIDRRWQEFNDSYAGLSNDDMLIPGVTEEWSVKDVIAHVATWDGEALKALPIIMAGKRPPRYGGVDNFNAARSEANSGLSLKEARSQLQETHASLLDFLSDLPESWYATETRFRHRLRLDTWGHYPEHMAAIQAWRQARR